MLSSSPPDHESLTRLADELSSRPLSYEAGLLDRVESAPTLPGSLRAWRSDGWFVDRYAEVVGHGAADFAAAEIALRDWAMFDQDWAKPVQPSGAIEAGRVVTYAARVLGVWWSYGCRILDVIDETNRFGFVYGTIDGHAERGEELFQVRLLDDDDVEFSLVAMSRPGRWFAWPGLPIARLAQQRFRPGAADGIRRSIASRTDEDLLTER